MRPPSQKPELPAPHSTPTALCSRPLVQVTGIMISSLRSRERIASASGPISLGTAPPCVRFWKRDGSGRLRADSLRRGERSRS
jgi:hypothetical protein